MQYTKTVITRKLQTRKTTLSVYLSVFDFFSFTGHLLNDGFRKIGLFTLLNCKIAQLKWASIFATLIKKILSVIKIKVWIHSHVYWDKL